jgi:hypothetical protein
LRHSNRAVVLALLAGRHNAGGSFSTGSNSQGNGEVISLELEYREDFPSDRVRLPVKASQLKDTAVIVT